MDLNVSTILQSCLILTLQLAKLDKYSAEHTELAKKVCPRLRDSPACTVARSRNLGQTFLANSVFVCRLGMREFHASGRRRPDEGIF